MNVHFDWNVNLGQLLLFLGLIPAFAGLALTYMQLKKSSSVHSAQILKDVIFQFFGDTEIQKTYYRIGEGHFKFDVETFRKPGSDDERQVDQLLYLFECVARLHALGLISAHDMLLRYRMVKVFTNPDVQAYLRYLDEEVYPKILGTGAQAFHNARALVQILQRDARRG
jgi:hypothetical protein